MATPSTARQYQVYNLGIPVKTKTYASAAAMAVANAIKLSVATVASLQTYSGSALDGSIGQGAISLPQSVTCTTQASAVTYAIGAGNAITVTGPDYLGSVVTGTITLTATGGGETIAAVDTTGALVGYASVTSLRVPAQLLTSGHFTFGVRDVVVDQLTASLRGGLAASNIVVGYADGSTDTYPTELAELVTSAVRVIYSTSAAFPITIGV